MFNRKKRILALENDNKRLSTHIDFLYNTIAKLKRECHFHSTHDRNDIVLKRRDNIIEIEYCTSKGFNVAIFIDSYLIDHIDDPITTHSHDENHVVFSSGENIYVLNKNTNICEKSSF